MSETAQALLHNYKFIRGKAYNDRLVFSPHFTRHIIAMCRAFSRFGNVALIGPKGINIDMSLINGFSNYKILFFTLVHINTKNIKCLNSFISRLWKIFECRLLCPFT